jgi:hypothetical protein
MRSKHGYSATKYEASPAKTPETWRHQFGLSYDVKKIRNKNAKFLGIMRAIIGL